MYIYRKSLQHRPLPVGSWVSDAWKEQAGIMWGHETQGPLLAWALPCKEGITVVSAHCCVLLDSSTPWVTGIHRGHCNGHICASASRALESRHGPWYPELWSTAHCPHGDQRPVVCLGSVLEPEMFNIFFGDVNSRIKCVLSKFAEDITLRGTVAMLETRDAIQRDLDMLQRWAHENLMQFNKETWRFLSGVITDTSTSGQND